MLMANSVEGRFPFLDVNVVTFANRLPARHKLFGVDEKHLLKLAFADLVPEAVRHRPKQPYRAPDAASFYAGGRPDWLADVLSPAEVHAAGVFDPVQVGGLVRKAAARSDRFGNTDNMRMLAVLSTQLVHRQFIADDPAVHARSAPPEPVHVFDLVHNESEQR
jgi:asparagine synthase (glutamine-hydrolysing)